MNELRRFWSKVVKTEDCWLWTGPFTRHGYGQFRVGGREGYSIGAHRFSLSLVTEVPAGSHVLHSCDKPPCVNPAHLRLGTHAENMRDMAARERSRTTKLTAGQVRSIRAEAAEGATHSALAERYSVSKSNIQAIASRQTWRHLT